MCCLLGNKLDEIVMHLSSPLTSVVACLPSSLSWRVVFIVTFCRNAQLFVLEASQARAMKLIVVYNYHHRFQLIVLRVLTCQDCVFYVDIGAQSFVTLHINYRRGQTYRSSPLIRLIVTSSVDIILHPLASVFVGLLISTLS